MFSPFLLSSYGKENLKDKGILNKPFKINHYTREKDNLTKALILCTFVVTSINALLTILNIALLHF